MDRWGWEALTRWQEIRATLPIGALFCVIHGPTAGRRWEASAARKQLRRTAEDPQSARKYMRRAALTIDPADSSSAGVNAWMSRNAPSALSSIASRMC